MRYLFRLTPLIASVAALCLAAPIANAQDAGQPPAAAPQAPPAATVRQIDIQYAGPATLSR